MPDWVAAVVNPTKGQGVYLGGTKSLESVVETLSLLRPVKTDHNLVRIGGEREGTFG